MSLTDGHAKETSSNVQQTGFYHMDTPSITTASRSTMHLSTGLIVRCAGKTYSCRQQLFTKMSQLLTEMSHLLTKVSLLFTKMSHLFTKMHQLFTEVSQLVMKMSQHVTKMNQLFTTMSQLFTKMKTEVTTHSITQVCKLILLIFLRRFYTLVRRSHFVRCSSEISNCR